MRTDHIFYKIFKAFPETLFALLDVPMSDFCSYVFDSVEVKETALRIDGVFVPNDPGQPYCFVEVQFQVDAEIYWRLFAELLLYMRQGAPQGDWRAVIVFAHRTLDVRVPPALSTLAADGRFQRVYLNELVIDENASLGLSLMRLVVEQEGIFPERARRLLERAREQFPVGEARRQALEFIETIIVYKLQYSLKEIRAMFSLNELKQTSYVQGLIAEAKAEARREAERETLLRLLHEKFGALPEALTQRIAAVQDEQQLAQLSVAVLKVSDLDSFSAYLQQQ
jgi:predicted transposase/invertase (TIGR01784 family)